MEQRRLRSQDQTLGWEEREAGYKDLIDLLWLEERTGKYSKFGSCNFAKKERRKKEGKRKMSLFLKDERQGAMVP